MLIALWILNGLLALGFLFFGITKLVRSPQALESSGMAWVADFRPPFITFVAVVEIVGALGLILPLLTGIAPVLTPIAAIGLAIVMVAAVVVHVRRREAFAPALVLAALSAVSAVLGFLTI